MYKKLIREQRNPLILKTMKSDLTTLLAIKQLIDDGRKE